MYWPGEIRYGNGQEQAIIDERADRDQREALTKILLGEATNPGATHFFVYNSTMTTVHETLYAPVNVEVEIENRTASVRVDGIGEADGSPIIGESSGKPVRRQIHFPDGFEFEYAEVGNGKTRVRATFDA